MKIRVAGPMTKDSIVDGEGLRAVVWTQGCPHACPSCHNPSTHSYTAGKWIDLDDIKKEIDTLDDHDGITLSGGDPLEQPAACLEIARHSHKRGLNVWCYTGYRWEELMRKAEKEPIILEFLKEVDRLIDGRFIIALKSFEVPFRGSRNQRIIDVAATFAKGTVVEDEKYLEKPEKKQDTEKIYI